MGLRFKDTGASDEEELAPANRDLMRGLADVEGIGHVCYLTIAAATGGFIGC
jgi:hypothetical protein